MASFDEFYRSLPEDSNKRGEYFEKVFIPWFLKTDPVWSSKVNQVWLWDDYPQRWGKDCGIDLVYEDPQGKHWGKKCHCYHQRGRTDIQVESPCRIHCPCTETQKDKQSHFLHQQKYMVS